MALGLFLIWCETASVNICQQAEGVGFYRAILARTGKFENAAGMVEHSLVIVREQPRETQVGARPGFGISELAGARGTRGLGKQRYSFIEASRQRIAVAQRGRDDRNQIIDLARTANR